MYSRKYVVPATQPTRPKVQMQEDVRFPVEARGDADGQTFYLDSIVFWLFCASPLLFLKCLLASYMALVTLFGLLLCLPIGDSEHAVTTDSTTRFVDAFLFSFQSRARPQSPNADR